MQPFHIFRKDALHLWPEILVSLALLISFAFLQALTLTPDLPNAELISFAAGVLRFLLPVMWLVLISRLVHDEELVGDRQFWITRPYTWYSLLLAKLLFVVVVICVPLALAQAWMLHHAGLYPTHAVPAMLADQVYICGFALLPLLALAAVTATFVRYISSVLGGLIYVLVVVGIGGYFLSEKFGAPGVNWTMGIAALALIVFALLIQYARRRTAIARIALIVVPLVIVLIAALTPLNALMEHRYAASAQPPVTLTFLPSPASDTTGLVRPIQHRVRIELPFSVTATGLASDSLLVVLQVRAVIDTPDGQHVDTGWQAAVGSLAPGSSSGVSMLVPEKLFAQFGQQPVAMHLEVGVQRFDAGTPYTVGATTAAFPMPEHGQCTLSDEGSLNCRSAYMRKQFLRVTATIHSGSCAAPGPMSAPVYTQLPPAFSLFDPVVTQNTAFTFGPDQRTVKLCPNTPITFTPQVEGKYLRLHADIAAITLNDYVMRLRTQLSR
jgi:hypothetical protein